ncbi:MAG: MFS transporter [Pantoea sp.]|uniref:MFS transporter n=1 Tax=Pantoea sp. TaxID=69393 RepID=UPI0039E27E30
MNKVKCAPAEAEAAVSLPFSATAMDSRRAHAKSLFAVTLGNGLEIYDFAVYSFFSVIIGHLFFPTDSDSASLLLAVATFGVGFFMRPLGSLVLGHYADKHGRKAALTLIMALMALGVALVAFAPTYEQVGMLAPALLVCGRLLQGFSAGGEVGAATSWLMEAGGKSQRGVRVSWQMASQGGAALLGAAMGALLTHSLSHDALYSWGWRIPFIVGLAIMPVGIYIRRHLNETHTPSAVHAEGTPAARLWREHRRTMLLGILLVMKSTTTFYIIVYYMPAYMVHTLHMPEGTSYWISLMAATLTLVVPFFAGKLADRLPRRKPLLLGCGIGSLLLVWPIFASLHHGAPFALTIALISLDQILANITAVAFFLLILEAFPRPVRASGMALIYAIGVTLFGGFAQFNVTWLLNVTGDAMAPAWYLLLSAVVSLSALLAWREQPVLSDD